MHPITRRSLKADAREERELLTRTRTEDAYSRLIDRLPRVTVQRRRSRPIEGFRLPASAKS